MPWTRLRCVRRRPRMMRSRPNAGPGCAAEFHGAYDREPGRKRMTAPPEHVTMPVFHRLPNAHRDEQIAHIAEAARQIRIKI